MKKFLLAIALIAATLCHARAQSLTPGCSNPPPNYGLVWTPGQWTLCLSSLQPSLGYTPVNRAGDAMQGLLVTTASTVSSSGFRLPQGTAPTSPTNGDMWMTSSGLFFRVAGVTVGPISTTVTSVNFGTSGILSGFGTGRIGLSDSTTATEFDVFSTTDSTSSPTNSAYAYVKAGVTAGEFDFGSTHTGSGAPLNQFKLFVDGTSRLDFNVTYSGGWAFPSNGVVLGSPTGGNEGIGTINAGSYFIQGVQIPLPSGSANTPLFNNGSNGLTNGTRSGNTTEVATVSGALVSGNLAKSDASGNVVDAGIALSAGQYPGTATNNNASAGNVGEFAFSQISSGSAVGLTTSTIANITSVSLTAGDWDVWGVVTFTGNAATNVTGALIGSISTANNTIATIGTPGYANVFAVSSGTFTADGAITAQIVPMRVSISGTTSYFLNAEAVFTTSTASAYGFIAARRVR